MPTGLAIPLGVSSTGGAKLVSSDSNNSKIIALALGDDDNENAFQQNIGLGVEMIWAIEEPPLRARIAQRIRTIFRRFEAQKRFRLFPDTISWESDSENQDLILTFKYLDIESDETEDFTKTFSAQEAI